MLPPRLLFPAQANIIEAEIRISIASIMKTQIRTDTRKTDKFNMGGII